MIQLLFLMLIQTAMLAFGQVFFKLGMQKVVDFTWTWDCIAHQILLNGWLIAGVILLVVTNLYWLWLLNHYPFSIIYPLTSLGFILGMLAGVFIFHETVTWMQWLGVVFVMGGCFMIAK